MYGKGISKEGELIDLAVQLGILKRSGAWFYYGELRMAQGRDNAKTYLTENVEIYEEVYNKVMDALLSKGEPEGEIPAAPLAEDLDQPVIPEEKKKTSRISIDVAVDD